MENIEPWCISRQLWWGPSDSGLYGPDKKVFVAFVGRTRRGKRARQALWPRTWHWRAIPTVLDTWFSSALWPFSTLGWPDQTIELKKVLFRPACW